MNWVRKKSLPTIKSISYENQPYNTLLELWHALHLLYNSAKNKSINTTFLSKLPQVDLIEQLSFSKQEFRDALAKCSASSAPGPDHITQRYCKGTLQSSLGNLIQVSIIQLALGSLEPAIHSSLPSYSRCHGQYYIALLGIVVISVLICVSLVTGAQTGQFSIYSQFSIVEYLTSTLIRAPGLFIALT